MDKDLERFLDWVVLWIREKPAPNPLADILVPGRLWQLYAAAQGGDAGAQTRINAAMFTIISDRLSATPEQQDVASAVLQTGFPNAKRGGRPKGRERDRRIAFVVGYMREHFEMNDVEARRCLVEQLPMEDAAIRAAIKRAQA